MIEYVGKCLIIENKGEKLLVVGDLHLGFEESLNRAGVMLSREMFDSMLDDFNEVFGKVGKVDKVILLGDVKHNFGDINRQEWNDVLELFNYLEKHLKENGEILVVRGNHDNYLKNIAGKKDVKVEDYYIFGEYCFLHGDRDFEGIYNKDIKYWIMAHGHPAINLSDGIKRERYKCFLEGKYKDKNVVIVPSFIDYVEGSDPRENEWKISWKFDLDKFNVKVVGENLEVLEFGKLKNIN